jgi:hypothetical protein
MGAFQAPAAQRVAPVLRGRPVIAGGRPLQNIIARHFTHCQKASAPGRCGVGDSVPVKVHKLPRNALPASIRENESLQFKCFAHGPWGIAVSCFCTLASYGFDVIAL